MTAAEIVADPIGQLNLMLWMTQPLPDHRPVRPILREAGYRLFAIGPAMPLLPDLRERLQNMEVSYRPEPEPDLLLVSQEDREFMMLECKRAMFGPDSSSADQARGLLLQTGEQFNTVVGLAIDAATETHLVYVAEHCDSPEPTEGLLQIRNDLREAGLPVAPAGVVCVQAREDAIYLRDEYGSGVIPQRLHNAIGREVRIQDIVEGEDAMPILLVPWDPNVDQGGAVAQFGRQVLCHRVLGSLVIRIGQLSPRQQVEVGFDDLLNEATFHFFDRWLIRNAQVARALRGFCRTILHEALKDVPDLQAEPLGPGRAGRRITVLTGAAKESAIDAITKYSRKACPEIAEPDQPVLPLDVEE